MNCFKENIQLPSLQVVLLKIMYLLPEDGHPDATVRHEADDNYESVLQRTLSLIPILLEFLPDLDKRNGYL